MRNISFIISTVIRTETKGTSETLHVRGIHMRGVHPTLGTGVVGSRPDHPLQRLVLLHGLLEDPLVTRPMRPQLVTGQSVARAK